MIDMKTVSVFMITYNHQEYISQAIESIVTQDVNFDFELVIGEDSSNDNTRRICERYKEQYPNVIKLLPSDRKYGMMGNFSRTLSECDGKYVAICEGDDFWIDQHKLQKQVDFLEENVDFTICFSDIDIVDHIGDHDLNNKRTNYRMEKDVFTIEDIISAGVSFIPTATLVFRNVLPRPLPDFFKYLLGGDIALQLMLADKGKAKYFPEKTAVYRINEGGISRTAEFRLKGHRAGFESFDKFNEYTNFKYHESIKKLLFPASKTLLIYESGFLKGKERWEHIFRMIRGYNRYRDGFNVKEIAYYNVVLFFPFIIRMLRMLKSGGSTQAKAETK